MKRTKGSADIVSECFRSLIHRNGAKYFDDLFGLKAMPLEHQHNEAGGILSCTSGVRASSTTKTLGPRLRGATDFVQPRLRDEIC
jgi:hypothetical protein